MRADAGHFGFDPGFRAIGDFVRRESGRVDGRADADGNVPHFLNKALRPQNSPEFSATGITGVPVSTARWAPPIL
jgi:hypothetical protein